MGQGTMTPTAPSAPLDVRARFEELFKPAALVEVFQARFAESPSKGIDRLNGFQFAGRAPTALAIASSKCLTGRYRFSPYLELLKIKGREKPPRLIAIPTVRDRVVLHQLNKLLASAFPECVPRNIAHSYIRAIITDLNGKDPETTYVCGRDIKTFYDSIQRGRLLALLDKRLRCPRVTELIKHAIVTPAVPQDARRQQRGEYATKTGVPQGLAISNILSAVYLHDVDEAMQKLGVTYFRYVDDVLMYGPQEEVRVADRSLIARLRPRGLRLHPGGSGKTHMGPLTDSFGYLGYHFQWPVVTVRASTVERLLQSIAAKFSDYVHNKTRRLERHKYLTEGRLAEIFLLELNERISGAISEKRRYGWIAYYSQINDLSLLHRLDDTVSRMFQRLADFNHVAPPGLKTFRRSHFEMKYNPSGGYIRDYDKIVSPVEKLAFLRERGRVDPGGPPLTNEQIDTRFERYRRRVLSDMQADEGVMYG
jgi:RNA-directed DNA polymerase